MPMLQEFFFVTTFLLFSFLSPDQKAFLASEHILTSITREIVQEVVNTAQGQKAQMNMYQLMQVLQTPTTEGNSLAEGKKEKIQQYIAQKLYEGNIEEALGTVIQLDGLNKASSTTLPSIHTLALIETITSTPGGRQGMTTQTLRSILESSLSHLLSTRENFISLLGSLSPTQIEAVEYELARAEEILLGADVALQKNDTTSVTTLLPEAERYIFRADMLLNFE